MKKIRLRSNINSSVKIPGSKSITHRALITASLADGDSLLKEPLVSEDILHTVKGLQALGAKISFSEKGIKVAGTGGDFRPVSEDTQIFLGNSGTSFRLLLSLAALAPGHHVLTGTPRICERPIGELVNALNQLGVEVFCTGIDGFPPVSIRGKGLSGGKAKLSAKQSSQFVSSLLLTSPYAQKDVEIEILGELVSKPYVALTLEVMNRFGVAVQSEDDKRFKIPSGQRYQAGSYNIEGDASSASYFWGAAAVTEGTSITKNISSANHQGDMGFLSILEKMGCSVEIGSNQVKVYGGPLTGIDVDMSNLPDLVPTLAAIALFAEGQTRIRNVSHLRHKESDRLNSVTQEWKRLGARIEELPDGLVIHGNRPLSGAIVNPHDDHRIAMSLAVVGLRIPGIEIRNEACVKKSFPEFWDLWDTI